MSAAVYAGLSWRLGSGRVALSTLAAALVGLSILLHDMPTVKTLASALSFTNAAARQCTTVDYEALKCDCPDRIKSVLQACIDFMYAGAIWGPFSSQGNAGHRAGGHGFGARCQENTVEALQSLLARDGMALVAELAYVEFDIHVRARTAAATDRCMLAGHSRPCSPPVQTRRCPIQDRCLHLIGGRVFRNVIHQ